MKSFFSDDDHPDAPLVGIAPNPLAQLRGYWEGLRLADSIPQRSQISPRGIEAALSCTFLLERIAPGIARFRIAGMDLADLMGMEVRGLPFSTIFSPAARADICAKLEAVFQAPAIMTSDLVAERGLARPALLGQLLIMPLRDDQGRITMALGCLALQGKIGRSPRRFETGRSSLTRLERPAPRLIPKPVEATNLHAFAEASVPFTCAKASSVAPYLRLVK